MRLLNGKGLNQIMSEAGLTTYYTPVTVYEYLLNLDGGEVTTNPPFKVLC